MRTNCFELFPAGECSVYGTCVVVDSPDNSTFQERCVCDPGWSQSKEMSLYFLDKEDIKDRKLGLCTHNDTILTALYIFALVATIMAFLHQILKITKKKQLIRLFPLLLGFLLNIFLCTYKLSDFDGVNLGQDPLFTALFRNMELLYIAAVTISFQRYIFYILKRTQLGNLELTKKARVFSTTSNYVLLSDFIIYQVLWLTIFMPRKIGYNVIRIFLGLTLVRNQFTLFMVYTLFGTIIRDLRTYLLLLRHSKNSTRNLAVQKSYKFAKKSLVGLIPAIFPFVLYTLGYQVPLMFIVWSLVSLVATNTRRKERISSTNSTKTVNAKIGDGHRLESPANNSSTHTSAGNRIYTAGASQSQIREVLKSKKEKKQISI
eukprot:snap_masked-scaffold_38-processed-gene-0.25-mRNA-1 protein AED:1.00 eAED:1.00 QI:0/0/0/0/1/1/2/0/374